MSNRTWRDVWVKLQLAINQHTGLHLYLHIQYFSCAQSSDGNMLWVCIRSLQHSCEVSWPAAQNNPIKVCSMGHTQGQEAAQQRLMGKTIVLLHSRLIRTFYLCQGELWLWNMQDTDFFFYMRLGSCEVQCVWMFALIYNIKTLFWWIRDIVTI